MAKNVKMKAARAEKDLTQEQLAAAVGVSRQTIHAIEKGEFNPSIKMCCAICRVLDRKLDDLFWEEGQELPDAEKKNRPVLDRNYAFYAEPEAGINDPQEFNDELCAWASREHHDLEILKNSMEPEVLVDGRTYVCRLGEPNTVPLENMLFKKLNLPMYNRPFGRAMGYKWIYFYQIEE